MRARYIITGIVALVVLTQAIFDINLPWVLAELILIGRIPLLDINIGFIGVMTVLIVASVLVGKVVHDAKIDVYENAIQRARTSETPIVSHIATIDEQMATTTDTADAEDFETALA